MKTPCQAIVDSNHSNHGARRYTRQHITVMGSKPCSRDAVSKVGQLCLCRVHARMALEGLVDEGGRVAPRSMISDVRRYPKQFPHGLYRWAQGLEAMPVDSEKVVLVHFERRGTGLGYQVPICGVSGRLDVYTIDPRRVTCPECRKRS